MIKGLDVIPAVTGAAIQTATMDGAYAITRVFASLEQRGIEAIVPAKRERPRDGFPDLRPGERLEARGQLDQIERDTFAQRLVDHRT